MYQLIQIGAAFNEETYGMHGVQPWLFIAATYRYVCRGAFSMTFNRTVQRRATWAQKTYVNYAMIT